MRWPFAFGAMQPTRIVEAHGVELVLEDDRRILDAAGGAIVANIGHGRPEVADVIETRSCGARTRCHLG